MHLHILFLNYDIPVESHADTVMVEKNLNFKLGLFFHSLNTSECCIFFVSTNKHF